MVIESHDGDAVVRPNANDAVQIPMEIVKNGTTGTWSPGATADLLPTVAGDSPSSETSSSTTGGSGSELSREKWGRNIEFLLSCVALSVGFGNVWRFPYTAMKNGGGAFLIPYLIVLFLVGRPLYYLEMVMGQFSSRGCVKVFDVSPLMRGIGVGQTLTMLLILGFYASILAISVRYFVASFSSILPWAYCRPEWTNCVDSDFRGRAWNVSQRPSAEFYFDRTVLNSRPSLDEGVGLPDWRLALCLLACWICITVILIRGIRSSGKAAYFLAIFPYVILLVLLVRICTLDGAGEGILYLLKPQWDQLLNPEVWYAAVTQCFFSLTISLGAVIVFASYNNFSNNIYRDAMIISWLDTFTSIISGIAVFGIVGNISHITGNKLTSMKLEGPSLIFITYPDALAKFDAAQNVFAVLFFLMFFLLGLGSNTGIVTTIVAAVQDRFPQLTSWKVVLVIAIYGFSCGLVYITPGGLHVLDVVNKYGVEMTVLTLVLLEIITFCWMYGVRRICNDIRFMLARGTGIFWRVCWSFVTFGIILLIWIFSLVQYKPSDVPLGYNVFGWCLFVLVVVQVPLWAIFAVRKRPERGLVEKIKAAARPTFDWGPEDETLRAQYRAEVEKMVQDKVILRHGEDSVGKTVFQKICTTLRH